MFVFVCFLVFEVGVQTVVFTKGVVNGVVNGRGRRKSNLNLQKFSCQKTTSKFLILKLLSEISLSARVHWQGFERSGEDLAGF